MTESLSPLRRRGTHVRGKGFSDKGGPVMSWTLIAMAGMLHRRILGRGGRQRTDQRQDGNPCPAAVGGTSPRHTLDTCRPSLLARYSPGMISSTEEAPESSCFREADHDAPRGIGGMREEGAGEDPGGVPGADRIRARHQTRSPSAGKAFRTQSMRGAPPFSGNVTARTSNRQAMSDDRRSARNH